MTVASLSLTDVRNAIASNIRDNISGLQVSARVMAEPSPPSCDVRRGPVEYDQAMMESLHRWTMLVRVFVAGNTDAAQDLLNEYTSPNGDRSIKQAVESDPTLGGLIQDLRVTGCTGDTPYVYEGRGPMLGSEWTIELWI